MTETFLNKVYDLLVSIGGAQGDDYTRRDFVYSHLEKSCEEWRFSGFLGFGGKYYSGKNKVNCYDEDMTSERFKIIARLNKALDEIK